jgi:hypothetical protein
MPVLAQTLLALGYLADAEKLVAAGLVRARRHADRLGLTEWLWLQGRVWMGEGRYPDAQRAYEEGVTLAREMPYPYAEGRLRAMGELHGSLFDLGPSLDMLRAAEAVFRRLGALGDLAGTAGLSASLGTAAAAHVPSAG